MIALKIVAGVIAFLRIAFLVAVVLSQTGVDECYPPGSRNGDRDEEGTAMIFPPWWQGATIDAKAGYLVRTNQAKSYADACAVLSALRRRKPKPRAVRLPYAD